MCRGRVHYGRDGGELDDVLRRGGGQGLGGADDWVTGLTDKSAELGGDGWQRIEVGDQRGWR